MATTFAAFLDLTSGEQNVLTLNPNEIKDGSAPKAESTPVPGGSHPQIGIGAGGARMITFKLRIARTQEIERLTYVRDQISWFKSVLSPYPISSFQQFTWTPLQFRWGDLYDLPVVLRGFDTTFLHFRPEDALPEFADADFRLEEVAPETITSPEIRFENKGFVRYL